MSSYLVIARKWRPSVFEEIIGQDHVTKTLRNAISTGRVAQAYLFSGPRGVGKTTAARILAKSLNCTAGSGQIPCNECPSCINITSGASVDVMEIDGASNTGVENVRDLRENIMYMPAGGRRKIYIIDEVHMLSIAAFNALLKTLEEPPPHVVFIFATTEVKKIPLTILSRCQRYEFRRISVQKMEAHLKKILLTEKIAFEEDALFAIAREADGSLRDAESLLDQVLAFGGESVRLIDVTEALGLMDRSVLLELMRAIVDKNGGLSLNIIEKIYNFGYDLKKACGELLAIVRDMTAIKVTGGTTVTPAPAHELTALKDIAEGTTAEDLHMLFLLLQKGYEGLARSAFARHSFEMTVLRASSFDSVKSIDELIKGLNALGRGARGGAGSAVDVGGGANSNNSSSASQKRPVRAAQGLPWQSPATTVKKGPGEFKKGACDLKNGTGNLKKGAGNLKNGAGDFKKAPGDFKKAAHDLATGRDHGGEGAVEVDKGLVGGPPGQGGGSGVMESGLSYSSSSSASARALSESGAENNHTGLPGQEQGGAPEKPSEGASGIEGLIGYIKKRDNGALHSLLKAAAIEVNKDRVEVKTDPRNLISLDMKKARMEELFSEYLKEPVKVVLTARSAVITEKKDPHKSPSVNRPCHEYCPRLF